MIIDIMIKYDNIYKQCPKLRVHPAPGVHISAARCTIFGGAHQECARFLLRLYHYNMMLAGCMANIPGAEFLGEGHLVGAQDNKTLISDTV